MVAFDTLKASRRLRDAGFEEKQADALVNAFAEDIGANLATKDDIILLRKDMTGEIAALRKDMTGEIAAVRKDMTGEIAAVRKDMTGEIAAVRKDMTGEIAAVRQEMASGFESLRKDVATEVALLEQRMKIRLLLTVGGATTVLLAAMGTIAGIIVSRL